MHTENHSNAIPLAVNLNKVPFPGTLNAPSLTAKLLVSACFFIGTIARIIAVVPLTSNPIINPPFVDDGFYYLQIAQIKNYFEVVALKYNKPCEKPWRSGFLLAALRPEKP